MSPHTILTKDVAMIKVWAPTSSDASMPLLDQEKGRYCKFLVRLVCSKRDAQGSDEPKGHHHSYRAPGPSILTGN